MTELTPEEKIVLAKIVDSETVDMSISFSLVGLERFAGVGTATVNVGVSDDLMKMQATHAVSGALLAFYKNIDLLQKASE